MINQIKKAAYQQGYLLIAALWLYTISFIFINYWSYHASPNKVKNILEDRLEQKNSQYESLIADTALMYHLIADSLPVHNPVDNELGIFIYATHHEEQGPVYWNNNQLYIQTPDLQRKSGTYFITNRNGNFELIKTVLPIRGKSYTIYGMVPVIWSFFIENKYLQTRFAGFEGLEEQYEISRDTLTTPILVNGRQELFRIKLKSGKSFIEYDTITILLRIMAMLLLGIFLQVVCLEVISFCGFYKGYLLLISMVSLLRLLMYFLPFPFDFTKLPLFDPSIYASNALHPSLGDLLVNTLLFFWMVRFFKKYHPPQIILLKRLPAQLRIFGRFMVLTFVCFLLAGIIISLVKDAKISFDVTNFFSLTIYSVISFVILCVWVLSFFYFSQICLYPVFQQKTPLYLQAVMIAIIGFAYLFFFVPTEQYPVYLLVLCWFFLYLQLMKWRQHDMKVSFLTSRFFIFWVMFFTLSIACLVVYQNSQVEWAQRERIAEKLVLQTDPSGENLLNIAATNFDDQFLTDNFMRFTKSEYANKFIKDSLINQNFSGYLNKYDTRIYTFDSAYHPLYNEDSLSYAFIKTILLNKAKPTIIPELYSYENPVEGFSYLFQKNIINHERVNGYLFVLIKSKRYKSEALYPELFNQAQDIATDLNTNYAYAVYNKGVLINHFNTYNFPAAIKGRDLADFSFSRRQVGDFTELWYNNGNHKEVLVVKRNTWLMEVMTLFAYLFCAFLCILLLSHIGSYLIITRLNWHKIKDLLRLNIRLQIQATIIFISVFSFLIIGIATISFFILRFNRNNEEKLTKSIQVMANEINSKMSAIVALDDAPENAGVKNALEKTIADISDLHNVDINYFNPSGNLLISTQPYIYNKHLLSEKMEPNAFQQLHKAQSIRYLQSEKIGRFEYLSIYVPLFDDKGRKYAYLNIPYLNSQSELNQEISGFLATLINLNAFIFLVAGVIAFYLTSRITASFSLIGEKMQQMSLGKTNQEIEWTRNDEIGMLVSEYNKMVKKLEQSAMALAKSEREGAWREMARQVAHEIKNPLTPMKLSIQYLQKAMQEGAANLPVLYERMSDTLIQQIDQLSKIAGDFSQFANIGNARMIRFSIAEVLTSLVQLYSANAQINISFKQAAGNDEILADKVQMSRLFTNLILNAIEAKEDPHAMVFIDISLQLMKHTVLITVADQSGGIPAGMNDQLFTPNFTTKTSGTGLGLAICKGIVEQANGSIWFETIEKVGTRFFVELPLANEA